MRECKILKFWVWQGKEDFKYRFPKRELNLLAIVVCEMLLKNHHDDFLNFSLYSVMLEQISRWVPSTLKKIQKTKSSTTLTTHSCIIYLYFLPTNRVFHNICHSVYILTIKNISIDYKIYTNMSKLTSLSERDYLKNYWFELFF